MKKLCLLFPLILCSCGFLSSTSKLREKHELIIGDIVKAYDSAVTRMYIDTLDRESQYIELQKKNAFLSYQYYLRTGTKPVDIANDTQISAKTYKDISDRFDAGKLDKIKQIQTDYESFTSGMNKALEADNRLSSVITDLEAKRTQMFGGFISLLLQQNENASKPTYHDLKDLLPGATNGK